MRIEGPEKPHGLRDVIAAVMAAALSVQSDMNRQRDFEHGSPRQFVVVAVIATPGFIGLVCLAVQFILEFAGVQAALR